MCGRSVVVNSMPFLDDGDGGCKGGCVKTSSTASLSLEISRHHFVEPQFGYCSRSCFGQEINKLEPRRL